MTTKSTNCSQELLTGFHSQTLSRDELTMLEKHLEECGDCRQSIYDRSADGVMWNKAAKFLCDSDSDLDELSDLSITEHEHAHSIVARVLDSLAPTDDPAMLGRVGCYEISGVVGAGGMGAVLKGVDPSLNRVVAIKIMSPHLASSSAARRRFAREAQSAAAITHQNVVDIYSVDEAGGLPYLVMPYIRGQSLQTRINEQAPLGSLEVLRIGIQVAAGLAAAHAQGLVHRDIKPANILAGDSTDRFVITDFGLARTFDDASLTRTGVLAGTPQYMSPEQARGEAVDSRSDLFSLGSVMYTAATGRPPFRSESAYGILRRITDHEPRSIREINPDIPEWLEAIIARLMSKDANDRYQTADEVRVLLESGLAYLQQPQSLPMPEVLQRSELQSTVAHEIHETPWTTCFFSTPEHIRTIMGRFLWIYTDSGEIRMTDRSLQWMGKAKLPQDIPFDQIESISIASYSRTAKPIRLDYFKVVYRDGEQTTTKLFTPTVSTITRVWKTNEIVAEWAERLQANCPHLSEHSTFGLDQKRAFSQRALVMMILLIPLTGLLVSIAVILVYFFSFGKQGVGPGPVLAPPVEVNRAIGETAVNVKLAPRVISTTPPIGATGIKASTNELIVSFDRDMDTTSMSWTGGPPYFPPVDKTREARWISARTCVLPVVLEAGQYYRVGINSTSYQKFRDAAGMPAPPIVICFTTDGAATEHEAKKLEAMVTPPKVVAFTPEDGADDVDPSTELVSVTFDMPMNEGMSWTGAAPAFPDSAVGKVASWSEDRLTCHLPVQLQSGRRYRIGINSLSHINFQSEAGVPVAPLVIEFACP
jgi:serine/threonine-protein kinase